MPEMSGEEDKEEDEEEDEDDEEEDEEDEDDFLAAALDEALEPRPAAGAAVSDLQISAVVRFLLWS